MSTNRLNDHMDGNDNARGNSGTINPRDLGIRASETSGDQYGQQRGNTGGLQDLILGDLATEEIELSLEGIDYQAIAAEWEVPSQHDVSEQPGIARTIDQTDAHTNTPRIGGLALPSMSAATFHSQQVTRPREENGPLVAQGTTFTGGTTSAQPHSQTTGQHGSSSLSRSHNLTYKLTADRRYAVMETEALDRLEKSHNNLSNRVLQYERQLALINQLHKVHQPRQRPTRRRSQPGPSDPMPPPLTPFQAVQVTSATNHFVPGQSTLRDPRNSIGFTQQFGAIQQNLAGTHPGIPLPYAETVNITTPSHDNGDLGGGIEVDRGISETTGQKKRCVDCSRNHATAEGEWKRCARCHTKYARLTASPPKFAFDPAITSDYARDAIYPPASHDRPLIQRDDWVSRQADEDWWVRIFVEAVSEPYVLGSIAGEEDMCHMAQQVNFNKAALTHRKGKFSQAMVNIRMRLLFTSVMQFHNGGPPVYPVGGDNDGYRTDYHMTCGRRLDAIANVLQVDKRICMDVIEGRGVLALVSNPAQYERRKVQNRGSNARKQNVLRENKERLRAAQAKDAESENVETLETARRGKRRAENAIQDDSRLPRPRTVSAPMDDPGDAALATPSFMPISEEHGGGGGGGGGGDDDDGEPEPPSFYGAQAM